MENFGFLANIIDACFLCFGKTGKFLNARKNIICFPISIFCLIYWFYIDIQRELYSQACGVFVSIAIDVYGWRKWSKK